MAPPTKATDGRRKSGGKPTLIVSLTVSASKLREIIEPESPAKEEDSPPKELKESEEPQETQESTEAKATKDSPATSGTLATPAKANSNSNGENASDSNAATPAAEGTPAPSAMGPPADGLKKKGVKRSAANANGSIDGVPKPRGKPGPKKKPRLEDGTIDHSNAANKGAGHKLGPKANQGAINAGLRALDRSGKPCRRWAKGGFQLKSFTGVLWEIPRWTAPPKKVAEEGKEGTEESAAASADNSSSKENKENGVQEGNSASNSNSGVDVEMRSAPSIHASSPAPMAVATAS